MGIRYEHRAGSRRRPAGSTPTLCPEPAVALPLLGHVHQEGHGQSSEHRPGKGRVELGPRAAAERAGVLVPGEKAGAGVLAWVCRGVSPRRTKPWSSGLRRVDRTKENLVLLPVLGQRRLRGHRSPCGRACPLGPRSGGWMRPRPACLLRSQCFQLNGACWPLPGL